MKTLSPEDRPMIISDFFLQINSSKYWNSVNLVVDKHNSKSESSSFVGLKDIQVIYQM
jgi:hypothetical protein